MTWQQTGTLAPRGGAVEAPRAPREVPYRLEGKSTTDLEDLYGSARVDAEGRIWTVVDVDERAACLAAELDAGCALDAPPKEEATAEEGTWSPNTWANWVCGQANDPVAKGYQWDAWDPAEVAAVADFTDRQARVVSIHRAPGGDFHVLPDDYWCSGVVVGAAAILTSAHCVWDDDLGQPLPASEFKVCTFGNRFPGADCTQLVDFVYPVSNWTGPTSGYAWDLAVLHTIANFDLSVGSMGLSSAGDGLVTSEPLHNASYNKLDSDCVVVFDDHGREYALADLPLFAQIGEAFAMELGVVKTRLDTMSGFSGSPIWFCGEHPCGGDDEGMVVSLRSGFVIPSVGPSYAGGPSIPSRRTWILNHL